jgi:hypothetical protein
VVFVDLNEQGGCAWDPVPLSATELVTVAVARAQYSEDWAHGPLAYAAALSASYELGDRFFVVVYGAGFDALCQAEEPRVLSVNDELAGLKVSSKLVVMDWFVACNILSYLT